MSSPSSLDTGGPPAKRPRIEEPEDAVEPEASTSTSSCSPFSLAYRLGQYSRAAAGTTSSERLVGISGYVNPQLPAFDSAIIKHRFTDFLVWEISKGGEVVRLRDISRPVLQAPVAANGNRDKVENVDQEEEEAQAIKLEDYMIPEKLEELQKFFESGLTKDKQILSEVCKLFTVLCRVLQSQSSSDVGVRHLD